MEVAVDILLALVKASAPIGSLVSSIAGISQEQLVVRLERAKAAIKDPIDPAPQDASRRARLERILRGEA